MQSGSRKQVSFTPTSEQGHLMGGASLASGLVPCVAMGSSISASRPCPANSAVAGVSAGGERTSSRGEVGAGGSKDGVGAGGSKGGDRGFGDATGKGRSHPRSAPHAMQYLFMHEISLHHAAHVTAESTG
eukprot:6212972-Pleurochrysis_carterae.AAC.4